MRSPSPTKTHRPKDFCTIEQAAYIAQDAILRHEAAKRFLKPHRKLVRFLRRIVGRLRVALRISGTSTTGD